MTDIIHSIREELKQNSNEHTQKSGQNFFKERVTLYGVKTAIVSKIGKSYFKAIQDQPKSTIFNLCETLWQSGVMEESFIACNWSYALQKYYEPTDFILFEKWIGEYVSNWASCDTFCNHTIGAFVNQYPEFITHLKIWTKSDNRWMRRASAVSLIIPARHGQFLSDIFEIADLLLLDQDDLVQKGYGWMLKAASESHQKEVFDFVIHKKAVMPRTALRYAIEKMPLELRKKAMEK